MSVTQWIGACQQGQAEAFTPLVARYQNLALGYAFSLLGDFHQAQDATQEAFLIAYRRLEQLREPEAFPGWLRGIVLRCCQRIFRKGGRTPLALVDTERAMEPGPSPVAAVQTQQEAQHLMRAIKRLPEQHRTIISMYYLEERSQQEVASFLGLSVSKVNNTLYDARQKLKRSLNTMASDTFREQRLSEEFARHIGEIIKVKGGLSETRINGQDGPDLFDLLGSTTGKEHKLVVLQRLDDGHLRCMSVGEGATTKGPLHSAGGYQESLAHLQEKHLREALPGLRIALDQTEEGIVETGLKGIDLFCPIPKGGTVGSFGKEGVGRAVFVMELIDRKHREAQGQQLDGPMAMVFFASRWTALGTQEMVQMEPAFATDQHEQLQTAWLLHPQAADPMASLRADYLDVSLYFSPVLATQGLWPAFDPLFSRSRALTPALVGKEHVALASDARALLQECRDLMRDSLYLEYLALDAREAAKERLAAVTAERMATLSEAQKVRVQRARKLERFLTQPFFVAVEQTGLPGAYVPLVQTLEGTRRILAGDFDQVEESELLWRGAI